MDRRGPQKGAQQTWRRCKWSESDIPPSLPVLGKCWRLGGGGLGAQSSSPFPAQGVKSRRDRRRGQAFWGLFGPAALSEEKGGLQRARRAAKIPAAPLPSILVKKKHLCRRRVRKLLNSLSLCESYLRISRGLNPQDWGEVARRLRTVPEKEKAKRARRIISKKYVLRSTFFALPEEDASSVFIHNTYDRLTLLESSSCIIPKNIVVE